MKPDTIFMKKINIIQRLWAVWNANPEFRLAQLIENVYPNTKCDHIEAYFVEDDDFIKTIEDFYKSKPVYRRFGKRR